jgi:hypothetical protein
MVKIKQWIPSPIFDLSEHMTPDIGLPKEGQILRLAVNAKVIEKTKSFAVLRISSVTLIDNKRKL